MHTVYLAGQISSDIETYNWRVRVRGYYRNNPLVRIIDPCLSEFNLEANKNGDAKEGFSQKSRTEEGMVLLPYKDRNYVKISNVIFFNLNHYTKEKPLLGTMFEMAWTFDDSSKMVIGIHKGGEQEREKNPFARHPFVTETVQVWVENERQACELLDRFTDAEKDVVTAPVSSFI